MSILQETKDMITAVKEETKNISEAFRKDMLNLLNETKSDILAGVNDTVTVALAQALRQFSDGINELAPGLSSLTMQSSNLKEMADIITRSASESANLINKIGDFASKWDDLSKALNLNVVNIGIQASSLVTTTEVMRNNAEKALTEYKNLSDLANTISTVNELVDVVALLKKKADVSDLDGEALEIIKRNAIGFMAALAGGVIGGKI